MTNTTNAAAAELMVMARTATGLRPSEVAGVVGVTPAYICDIEKGRRTPSHPLIAKLCDLYHLDRDMVTSLFGMIPPDIAAYLDQNMAALALLRALTDAQASPAAIDRLRALVSLAVLASHSTRPREVSYDPK